MVFLSVCGGRCLCHCVYACVCGGVGVGECLCHCVCVCVCVCTRLCHFVYVRVCAFAAVCASLPLCVQERERERESVFVDVPLCVSVLPLGPRVAVNQTMLLPSSCSSSATRFSVSDYRTEQNENKQNTKQRGDLWKEGWASYKYSYVFIKTHDVMNMCIFSARRRSMRR